MNVLKIIKDKGRGDLWSGKSNNKVPRRSIALDSLGKPFIKVARSFIPRCHYLPAFHVQVCPIGVKKKIFCSLGIDK